MRITASAIPQVLDKLHQRLVTAAELDGVQVTYGHPGKNPEDEFLFIGDTSEWEQDWASLGARTRDDRFTLILVVQVQKPGNDQQEATERAFEIFDIASTVILEAGDLDELLIMPPKVRVTSFDMFLAGAQGRGAAILGAVGCQARLSGTG